MVIQFENLKQIRLVQLSSPGQLDHFDIVPKGIAYEASVGDVTQIIALIDIISTLLNFAGKALEPTAGPRSTNHCLKRAITYWYVIAQFVKHTVYAY